MILLFNMAYKNLIGAGLRTWLNVLVLSFVFVIIIFYDGLIEGWNQQARKDEIAWKYGQGHLLHEKYDPFDPFTLEDGHGILPKTMRENLVPVLIRQAVIYPQGRMFSITLKGIDPNQNIIALPTNLLTQSHENVPALIGTRMASSIGLKEGDKVLLRWRDKHGTYDAVNVSIVGIFDSNVPAMDNGQIWISIEKMWKMTGLQDHATMYIAAKPPKKDIRFPGWHFKDQSRLLQELNEIIQSKKAGAYFVDLLLLAIALLAVFDTQVLAIFKRQTEIGTYIALGMTRLRVVWMFTIEGSIYSIMGTIVGCLYGIPLLLFIADTGIEIPKAAENTGLSIANKIYPVYGIGLILTTVLLVGTAATLVSFIPSKKIAKMNPVDALKGKWH